MTASIFSAYGRAASAAFCARRSFEAATICMALVIFCVALVAAMRTRMSLRLATRLSAAQARCIWNGRAAEYLPLKGGGRLHIAQRAGWGSKCGRLSSVICLSERLGVTVYRILELCGGGIVEILAVADRVENAAIFAANDCQ